MSAGSSGYPFSPPNSFGPLIDVTSPSHGEIRSPGVSGSHGNGWQGQFHGRDQTWNGPHHSHQQPGDFRRLPMQVDELQSALKDKMTQPPYFSAVQQIQNEQTIGQMAEVIQNLRATLERERLSFIQEIAGLKSQLALSREKLKVNERVLSYVSKSVHEAEGHQRDQGRQMGQGQVDHDQSGEEVRNTDDINNNRIPRPIGKLDGKTRRDPGQGHQLIRQNPNPAADSLTEENVRCKRDLELSEEIRRDLTHEMSILQQQLVNAQERSDILQNEIEAVRSELVKCRELQEVLKKEDIRNTEIDPRKDNLVVSTKNDAIRNVQQEPQLNHEDHKVNMSPMAHSVTRENVVEFEDNKTVETDMRRDLAKELADLHRQMLKEQTRSEMLENEIEAIREENRKLGEVCDALSIRMA